MRYEELQRQFYETFPAMVGKFIIALVILALVIRLFENKRFVRVLCRFVLLIPVMLVALILHVTKQ